jgi:hypothetical protein
MSIHKILTVTPENYTELGCPCFLNPKQAGHLLKLDWLKERFVEGFTVKHLFLDGQKKPNGFIEYTDGENAWRAVDAAGYLFIHCIWMNPNNVKNQGYGSLLVNDCIADAERLGKLGVAVVVSDGAFMAGKELFLKNGFEVAEQENGFSLLVKSLQKGPLPRFRNWKAQLPQFKGLNIVYSKQCPWVARSIEELTEATKENGLELKLTELKTPQQAQNAPSIYATFTLIYDGKIFADRYISKTRFLNILKKDLKLIK